MSHHTDQPDAGVMAASWPRLLSVKLLAQYLSVAEQTIRNRSVEIPGLVRMGRSVRWDRTIVDRWVAGVPAGEDLFGVSRKTLDNELPAR